MGAQTCGAGRVPGVWTLSPLTMDTVAATRQVRGCSDVYVCSKTAAQTRAAVPGAVPVSDGGLRRERSVSRKVRMGARDSGEEWAEVE